MVHRNWQCTKFAIGPNAHVSIQESWNPGKTQIGAIWNFFRPFSTVKSFCLFQFHRLDDLSLDFLLNYTFLNGLQSFSNEKETITRKKKYSRIPLQQTTKLFDLMGPINSFNTKHFFWWILLTPNIENGNRKKDEEISKGKDRSWWHPPILTSINCLIPKLFLNSKQLQETRP